MMWTQKSLALTEATAVFVSLSNLNPKFITKLYLWCVNGQNYLLFLLGRMTMDELAKEKALSNFNMWLKDSVPKCD